MQLLRNRWKEICSRRHIFKLTLLVVTIFIIVIQILQLFVNVHYNAIPHYFHRSIIPDNVLGRLAEVNIPFEIDPKLEGYTWLQCKCNENRTIVWQGKVSVNQSTCSKEATDFGLGQRVVSYSLFVSEPEAVPYFLDGIARNLQIIQEIYPEWMVRIYTNVPINKHSCALICYNSKLFWCNIKHIPALGDLSAVNGRMWRFLPIGDSTVDIFVSRDLDSLPTFRERSAVSEWERSNKVYHVMRDSHWHDTEILAGLWGAQNSLLDPTIGNSLRTQFIQDGKSGQSKSLDQIILKKRLFFPFLKDILAHDSYFCGKFKESITLPFPTKRNGQEFAGHDDLKEENKLFVGRLKSCPKKCRPSYGQDWEYC